MRVWEDEDGMRYPEAGIFVDSRDRQAQFRVNKVSITRMLGDALNTCIKEFSWRCGSETCYKVSRKDAQKEHKKLCAWAGRITETDSPDAETIQCHQALVEAIDEYAPPCHVFEQMDRWKDGKQYICYGFREQGWEG